MGRFDGRVVIVTGAARGLGRDYGRFFAQEGANVVLADVRHVEDATDEAAAQGPLCIGVQVDVTERDSVEQLMTRTRETFGRLDVLVNNAGLWRGLDEAGLLHCPEEVWDAAWAVNVTGVLRCYQAAVPLMVEGGWGRIINVSSTASRSGASAEGLTKHAVEHMTAGMAREVGDQGITVNCIAPGISAYEAATTRQADADELVAETAVKRLGASRDLFEAIAYLCSPQASWVTGQTLRIDGGTGI